MLPPDGGTSFTTAVRMVVRVHDHTSDCGSDAHMAFPAGFPDGDVAMVAVANGANGGPALCQNHSDFAGRHPHLSVTAFFRHKLCMAAGTADDLSAFSWLHLDVVDDGTHWDAAQRHCIPSTDILTGTGDDFGSDFQAFRSDNVPLFSICIAEEGDIRRAVRVILNGRYPSRDMILVPLEIDDSVEPLGTAAAVPDCNSSLIVPSGLLVQDVCKRLLWFVGCNLVITGNRHLS